MNVAHSFPQGGALDMYIYILPPTYIKPSRQAKTWGFVITAEITMDGVDLAKLGNSSICFLSYTATKQEKKILQAVKVYNICFFLYNVLFNIIQFRQKWT